MSHHMQQAGIAVLSSIGGVAALGVVLGAASQGARGEWFGPCAAVALACFGVLLLLGVK